MSKRKNEKPKTAEKQGEARLGLPRPALALIAVGVLVFLIYSVVSIVGIQSDIRKRRADLDKLNDQIKVQEIKLDNVQKLYNSTNSDFSALAEQLARDMGYIKEGERVFVIESGD